MSSDGLTTGSVYYWRVKHVDNDGLSSDWNSDIIFDKCSNISMAWGRFTQVDNQQ